MFYFSIESLKLQDLNMAEENVPRVPRKEWIELTIDEVKKAQAESPKNPSKLESNDHEQEIYTTDPKGFREYLKDFERKGNMVVPDGLTNEEKIAQVEVNVKALIDGICE
jgi:hypothetical protein